MYLILQPIPASFSYFHLSSHLIYFLHRVRDNLAWEVLLLRLGPIPNESKAPQITPACF